MLLLIIWRRQPAQLAVSCQHHQNPPESQHVNITKLMSAALERQINGFIPTTIAALCCIIHTVKRVTCWNQQDKKSIFCCFFFTAGVHNMTQQQLSVRSFCHVGCKQQLSENSRPLAHCCILLTSIIPALIS